jgi:hypothetical protein
MTKFRFVFCMGLMCALIAFVPAVPASASPVKADCQPGQGWSWVPGVVDKAAGLAAQQTLAKSGLTAQVTATQYGEMDSCDNFEVFGYDYQVELSSELPSGGEEALYRTLGQSNPKAIGKVDVRFKDGQVKKIEDPFVKQLTALDTPAQADLSGAAVSDRTMVRNVYMVVFEPLMEDGKTTLRDYKQWSDPNVLAQQTINFFKKASNNRLIYHIVERSVVQDFPPQVNGQKYTMDQYLKVLADPNQRIDSSADYKAIVDQFDLCTKLNSNEIDEVWAFNAPYFNFSEGAMVGTGVFGINGLTLDIPACKKQLPIMGPSVERSINESIHNFGHRTEATMSSVYGGWEENRTSHNWDRFGLNKFQSPNYSYTSCGSIHYPSNVTETCGYDCLENTLPTICEGFLNYPDLTLPPAELPKVNCSAWGCTELGFYAYWFSHLPHFDGIGPDGYLNDWLTYIFTPSEASYHYLYIAIDKESSGENPGSVLQQNGQTLCPGSCKQRIYFNHPVELTAQPSANFVFNNWGVEACSSFGANPFCLLSWIPSDQVAHAKFLPVKNLNIYKVGTGNGRVFTTETEKIDCGALCQAKYLNGSVILLKAEPDLVSRFVRWYSEYTECNSGTIDCKTYLWGYPDQNVTAQFALLPSTIKIQKNGLGSGKVSSTPTKLNCGPDCEAGFNSGTAVTLKAEAAPGMVFAGWTGACSGTQSTCQLTTGTTQLVVGALFNPTNQPVVVSPGLNGVVESEPKGINCGAACSFYFPSGETLHLTAKADEGYAFKSWSGACAGQPRVCEAMLNGSQVLETSAVFEAGGKITTSVSGKGTVISAPDGINCGNSCSQSFLLTDTVRLTAQSESGSVFAGWDGACAGQGQVCELHPEDGQIKSAAARFELARPVKVNNTGKGKGSISSSPAGINCGENCSGDFPSSQTIRLSAQAETGYVFMGWQGVCAGQGALCRLEPGDNPNSGESWARFEPTARLKVNLKGNGKGSVSSDPGGINCGMTCQSEFSSTDSFFITAIPEEGSTFMNWEGACTGKTPLCEIKPGSGINQEVWARFEPSALVELFFNGPGKGQVTSQAGNIYCDYRSVCANYHPLNQTIRLTAKGAPGFAFFEWEGICAGQTEICEFKLTDTQTQVIWVKFKPGIKVKVSVDGSEKGIILSEPSGINCGQSCEFDFLPSRPLKLIAKNNPGYVLRDWDGVCKYHGDECSFIMSDKPMVVNAFFDKLIPVNLSLVVKGNGLGKIISTNQGIDCGIKCNAIFQFNDIVLLKAQSAPGSVFLGWQNGCYGGSPQCSLWLKKDWTVTAMFSWLPVFFPLIH